METAGPDGEEAHDRPRPTGPCVRTACAAHPVDPRGGGGPVSCRCRGTARAQRPGGVRLGCTLVAGGRPEDSGGALGARGRPELCHEPASAETGSGTGVGPHGRGRSPSRGARGAGPVPGPARERARRRPGCSGRGRDRGSPGRATPPGGGSVQACAGDGQESRVTPAVHGAGVQTGAARRACGHGGSACASPVAVWRGAPAPNGPRPRTPPSGTPGGDPRCQAHAASPCGSAVGRHRSLRVARSEPTERRCAITALQFPNICLNPGWLLPMTEAWRT